MPSMLIPFGDEAAVKIAAAQAEAEALGSTNFQVVPVGNQYLLTWELKPRQGRPPKTETR